MTSNASRAIVPPSEIDPAYPQHGQATTQSVRENFRAARDEINELYSEIDRVDGRIDGGLSPPLIAETIEAGGETNLNAYRTAGRWLGSTGAHTFTNLPSDFSGVTFLLQVEGNDSSGVGSHIGQTLISTGNGRIWVRVSAEGTWRAWTEIISLVAKEIYPLFGSIGFGDLNEVKTAGFYTGFNYSWAAG